MSWSRRGSLTPLPLMEEVSAKTLYRLGPLPVSWPRETRLAQDKIERLVKELLKELGQDPEREGLKRTPHRVAESLRFLTQGCEGDLASVLNEAIFEEQVDEMVLVRDIEMYSLCEHHMLPFFGKCHV